MAKVCRRQKGMTSPALSLSKAVIAGFVTLMLLSAEPTPARACLACIAMPTESIADKMLAADAVVLLREDPGNPFAFRVVFDLKGSAETAGSIPFLVDTATRFKLAQHPEDAVLATWSADVGWTRLDHAGPELQQVARAILASADTWDADAAHDLRFEFFAALHDSPEPSVQQLALIELARIPYPQLRQMQPTIHRQEVASRLSDRLWSDWAPIYIVLLGLSDDPKDQAFVRRAMTLIMQNHTRTNLIPWTTAFIEVDGIDALTALEQAYFGEVARKPLELRDIGLALANHATTGSAEVQDRIATLFRAVAGDHPDLAAVIAGQLLQTEDWSQSKVFAVFLDEGLIADPGDEFVVASYIAAAREAQSKIVDN